MSDVSARPSHPLASILARRFAVAWVFLLVSAVLGALLRLVPLVPMDLVVYGYVLHAHSHVAFLGWVFNAFFVVALRHFIPADRACGYTRLWWILQIAVLGMLASFPAQGYGAVSIAFSTLHMAASAVFAWKLWRKNLAVPGARFFLRAALVCMLVSGLGPLALGPLAALDLRDSPAYLLAIYFYLHFQFNGWFVFFLLALWMQRGAEPGPRRVSAISGYSGWLLVAGGVLTYALSALWLAPPRWVYAVGLAGGILQLAGGAGLLAGLRPAAGGLGGGVSLLLLRIALGSLVLKMLLQVAAVMPGLSALASQRFVVVAFIHLIFLGLVTPALLRWAIDEGWLARGARRSTGIALYLTATIATEMVLVTPTLLGMLGIPATLPIQPLLFGASAVLVASVAVLGATLRTPVDDRGRQVPARE